MASSSNQPPVPGSPPSYDDVRQQAGPLPSKRGELGFIEGVHLQVDNREDNSTVALPARHPADRDIPPSEGNTAEAAPSANPASNEAATAASSSPSASEAPANKPRVFNFLTCKTGTLAGIRRRTLFFFVAQILVLVGCAIAWGFTAKKVSSMMSGPAKMPGGIPSAVFIHVVFAFGVIGQLIFLERRIYRLRAERYAYLHPGEVLPRYRDRMQQGGDLSFAYAPWNRPPLPTYAAALAQSGHGTGDVDDHLIAVPPPPAYGNTRGSRMLLQGFLTDEIRAQRPVSTHSMPVLDLERGDTRGEEDNSASSRRASRESNRERQREETLARLENSRSRT